MKMARLLTILLLLAIASTLSAALTKTTTMLTSSQNPSIYEQPVTLPLWLPRRHLMVKRLHSSREQTCWERAP